MQKNLSLSSITRSIVKKRWAIVSVVTGTVVGLMSAVICVYGHLEIFGFNIAYIVSPLIAGFAETYMAKGTYGKSTGAISAIVLFISINLWGWVLPENPITLNLFTLGGLALAFQAAFPILVNYLLFVVFLGTLTYLLGYAGNLMAKVVNKLGRKQVVDETTQLKDFDESISPEMWSTMILNTPNIPGKKIAEYLGIVNGQALMAGNGENGKSLLNGKNLDYGKELQKAIKMALKVMDEEAKSLGANAIMEVHIDYGDIGGLKGSTIMVNVMGNAVRYE
ncbi:YbjQ family protein [Methanobacterium paludis]|uniref:Uncharacterized protein n=1 Tax=Methanobacterium paludis (strain DSM 25820 / JCM 18151 / SWAN1) TaxID=868131 RepID=F6D430_METPW|nr:YbjQ family protein [Methanobacterium paludis]AEG19207.1 protein of unknown function DUF74 [Methanobacterium paludis]